jgi:hypothetical protein
MSEPYRKAAFDPQASYEALAHEVYEFKRDQRELTEKAQAKAARLKDYDQAGTVLVTALQVSFLVAIGIFCFSKAANFAWDERYLRASPYFFGDVAVLWLARGFILGRWWK